MVFISHIHTPELLTDFFSFLKLQTGSIVNKRVRLTRVPYIQLAFTFKFSGYLAGTDISNRYRIVVTLFIVNNIAQI